MPELSRTPKSLRTRETLLGAALGLFRKKGYDQTSMRDIADAAGMSVGASYYYFKSKDELVLAFYEDTIEPAAAANRQVCTATRNFDERFKALLRFKFDQFTTESSPKQDRQLAAALARSAADPQSPISPFHPYTREIRQAAIATIADAIEGSDLKVHAELKPVLPRLLWLFQMAVIYFWIMDNSKQRERTESLIATSVPLISTMLRLTSRKIPGFGNIQERLFEVIRLIDQDSL